MSKFQAPAILSSISHSADGGLRLGFITNELSEEDKIIATRFFQKFGFILFKENEVQIEDIPVEDAEEKQKTPSKRLRAVLFKYWTQQGKPRDDFEVWYRNEMEKIINHFKGKLE